MDDERAPPKARAGGDGITAAFTEFRSALMRLVGRIVGPNSIEDIVQETFIRSYEASRKQTINHPRSFMWKTAKNLALNHLQNSNNKLTTNVADFGDPNVYLAGRYKGSSRGQTQRQRRDTVRRSKKILDGCCSQRRRRRQRAGRQRR